MGWARCGKDSKGRNIGYAYVATCDHRGCKTKIDRGLSYACGGMHGENGHDCEKYFCEIHTYYIEDPFDQIDSQCSARVCDQCRDTWNKSLVHELLNEREELLEIAKLSRSYYEALQKGDRKNLSVFLNEISTKLMTALDTYF